MTLAALRVGAFLAAFPLVAFATPATSHRPEELRHLRTRTAYFVPPGEIEVGIVGSRSKFGRDTGQGRESTFELEVEFGLPRRFMIEVEFPYLWLEPDDAPRQTGLGDLELEFKWSMFGEGPGPAAAIGIETAVPTGDFEAGLGGGETEHELFLVFSYATDRWFTHVETTFEPESDGGSESEIRTAVEYCPGACRVVWQIATEARFSPGNATMVRLVPGVEFDLSRSRSGEFTLGLGLPIGIGETADDRGITVSFEFEF